MTKAILINKLSVTEIILGGNKFDTRSEISTLNFFLSVITL